MQSKFSFPWHQTLIGLFISWIQEIFLNGDLEEVYMDIPHGFEGKTNARKVCKLKKFLYGSSNQLELGLTISLGL